MEEKLQDLLEKYEVSTCDNEAFWKELLSLTKDLLSSVHCDGCGEMVNRKEWLGVCNKCRNK